MISTPTRKLPEDLNELCPEGNFAPPENLTVACYVFPGFHQSAFNDKFMAPGWTEYNLMRGSRPWFPGHHQPRQPLLGELDEALPSTWEIYNDLAIKNGVDVFIWDAYWYEDGPVFHEALDNGFLRASNCNDMKFAVMWTNHSWPIWSPDVGTDDHGYINFITEPRDQSREEVFRSITFMISQYTGRKNYWKIDGKPFFVIWDVIRLKNLFGVDGTNALLDDLREFAIKLGHKGLYLHTPRSNYRDYEGIKVDSYGDYNPLQQRAFKTNPDAMFYDYSEVTAKVVSDSWQDLSKEMTYYPSVGPGWDTCPRRMPHSPDWNPPDGCWAGMKTVIIKDEKPSSFKAFIQAAFAHLNEQKPKHPIMTIACWNEWTEGHYLLPDTRLGYGMLTALREARGWPEYRDISSQRYIGSLPGYRKKTDSVSMRTKTAVQEVT